MEIHLDADPLAQRIAPRLHNGNFDKLVFAPDDADLGALRQDPTTRVVTDTTLFHRLLAESRPVLVAVFAPPATNGDLDAVLATRRRRREMRVVLIDPPAQVAERLEMLRAGFDEAFDSSVDTLELFGRLALLADQARGVRTERRIVISPELVLDLDARELRVRGRSVHLRPREYELLKVLARNPGRTFTRQQLLDAVGADTTLRQMRTIDVHVRWLREKLETKTRVATRLVTVRGVGYRLERARPDRRGQLEEARAR